MAGPDKPSEQKALAPRVFHFRCIPAAKIQTKVLLSGTITLTTAIPVEAGNCNSLKADLLNRSHTALAPHLFKGFWRDS